MHELLKIVKSCKTFDDIRALPVEAKEKISDIVALDSQIEEWYLESYAGVVQGLAPTEW